MLIQSPYGETRALETPGICAPVGPISAGRGNVDEPVFAAQPATHKSSNPPQRGSRAKPFGLTICTQYATAATPVLPRSTRGV